MKIIDIGICIDNNDPKGLGRIRCVRYSEYVSEKERALEYVPYSKEDLFLVKPFLPLYLNYIPQVGESVKILNYNTDKSTLNQEYVPGPFSDSFNLNNQSFSKQIGSTTYGTTNKESSDIFDKNGDYRNKKSEGFFHKKTDHGIYGKKGSDIIFVEDGLVLRGGKLTDKVKLSPKERKKNIDFPIMGENIPRLVLKKFPVKLEIDSQENKKINSEIGDVKYLVEYEIDNFQSITKIDFYIYKNTTTNDKFKTNVFNVDTVIGSDFINIKGSNVPSHTIHINNIDFAGIEINNFLYQLFKGENKEIFKHNFSIDFPLYFRPTINNLNNNGNIETKRKVFNYVNFFGVGPMYGLMWSKSSIKPPMKQINEEEKILRPNNEIDESFGSVISDRIYLLSTDTNNVERSVNFNKISNYEPTHENYKLDIDPNTYSMVRGENLIRLLKSMIDVILTHEHNVVGPMVQNENYDKYVELMEYVKKIEDDLLNKSVKIN